MLKAKDFRQRAWGKLNGQWLQMALITLIFAVIIGILGGLSVYVIGAIALLIVSGPLLLGYAYCAIGVARKNFVHTEVLFSGFHQFTNSVVLYISNTALIILWSLLLIVPGIIKYYSYSMSYFILADNFGMPAEEARKRSIMLMDGNKWRLFCLHFSFIGWFFLCALTGGILSFWVVPYLRTAEAEFYQNLIHRDETADEADNFETVYTRKDN